VEDEIMELKKPDALGALAAKATEKTQQEPDAAADALVGKTSYTCHPMTNYSLGRFTFEKGTLALDEDDAAEFDKLHASQPPHLRHNVRKVDVAAAEARLKEILAESGQGADRHHHELPTTIRTAPAESIRLQH
jgi:hypothetical protein